MKSLRLNYTEIFKKLEFKTGDIVFLVTDLTNILINNRENRPQDIINTLLDLILGIIGPQGTLLVPTYNFNFCRGITYNYLKTPSIAGSLGKIALKRNDFIRTTNPIYSFAVAGKDRQLLYNLSHSSCFGLDSPFHYLFNNEAKYFSIGIDIKDAGFTPGHYIEEKVGVSYRYFKDFTGMYIDKNSIKKEVTYKFYVKDRSLSVRTGINEKVDELLMGINAYKKFYFKNDFYNIMNLKKGINFLMNDMINNPEDKRILYPERKGIFKRQKINTIKQIN